MEPYGNQFYLKKKVSYKIHNNNDLEKISQLNFKLLQNILDTINISLVILIFTLFFLSLDSQIKWSSTYKILSKTKANNNNLVDYISKTEEFYLSEIESLNTFRKTKPKDLIYLNKIKEKKESFFKKNFRIFIKGFVDSQYQKGY